jgi:hypothetical protein
VDVVVERPPRSSRTYAAFTIVVEFLFIAGMVWLWVWLIRSADTSTWFNEGPYGTDVNVNFQSSSVLGLVLRQIAALPHFIVLLFLGLAAFVVWFIVQWVILFAAVFPRGMHDVVAGYVRWYTRVMAYSLGLIDRYPPFTMSPSLTESTRATPSWPPAPPPPVYPQAPPPAADPPGPDAPRQS